MHQLSKTIKSYDKQADWHSNKFDGYDLTDYQLKFIKLLKGRKILDFGCGNGRDLEFFYKKEFEVIGIDYSDALIKKARSRINNVKVLKMDFLKKLDFKGEEFDGVWASASLIHVPKKSLNKVLSELKRIMKPKGVLFVSVKEGAEEKFVKDDFGNEKRFFSFFDKKELMDILNKMGFKTIESHIISDEKLRVGFMKKKTPQNWIMLYSIKT